MKSKIIKVLIMSTLCVTFYSCKKKKEIIKESEPTPIPTSPPPNKLDANIVSYFSFNMTKDSTWYNSGFVQATFFSQTLPIDSLNFVGPNADVGNAIVNTKLLNKNQIGTEILYNYFPANPLEAENLKNSREWQIAGNGTFSPMNFKDDLTLEIPANQTPAFRLIQIPAKIRAIIFKINSAKL